MAKLSSVAFLNFALVAWAASGVGLPDLKQARDRQDRGALDRIIHDCQSIAEKQPKDAAAQYQLALAQSYAAEVSVELRDKVKAKEYAEAGIQAAERAVGLNGNSAEYHRVLGTLCGQMISSNGLAALSYGKCALNEVNTAIRLDAKSSDNFLSHGVGNYYLPAALGGGVELAIKDFEKAAELNPKSSEAYLWLGIAQRKAKQNAAAHKALTKAVELNPNRVWAKEQLDKTPAQ